MARPSTVTMKMVAQEAGVSQATVSLVINGVSDSRVNPATQELVMQAVEKLGYRTNAFARSLRNGQSEMIGFISDEVATSPFAGQLLKGTQEAAWEHELVVLSVDTFSRPELEEKAIDLVRSYRVRGVIYACMYHQIRQLPKALRSVPTVMLNAQDANSTVPSVFPDEFAGGLEATRALLNAGHRRIGFISIQPPESTLPAGIGRLGGYEKALHEARIEVDPSLIRYGSGVIEDGERYASELWTLDNPPTALFCGNDRTAWGAYRAALMCGKRIPDDCSIVGFDNHEMLAGYFQPGLTTVALPYEQMAYTAVNQLLHNSKDQAVRTAVACQLITRDSITSRPRSFA